MDENIGVTETSDSSAVASAAGVTLKFPLAATQQVKKQNRSACYREMSPEPLMLLAAMPNHLSMSGNPDFVRMDSKVTPITDGIIPIGNPTSGLLIKRSLLHKYHSVTVQPFKIDELNPNERQSYLGVHRPTDTSRMLELLCGLHGLVVDQLAANHFLVSALVMIKCDRDNPLKVKVIIPHARALKTATDKQASNEIQVFTVSTAGEIPVPLPQQEYRTDLYNCVITTVINKVQIFAVTVLGKFLTLNKKSLSHTKPPAIRCIYRVILSEPVDSSGCITANVFCAIDLPTTRKILTEERKSPPDADGFFILSHDHIEMSYRITKGHGWLIPEKEHKVSALQILPSSQSENYEYPPSWKFKVFPDKSLKIKKVSSQVECHLNITAGRVKLVQERFNHTHPNQYHQLSASSSIDDPSSLHSAMTDSLTQGTTNSDIKGARHGDGDVHTNAHNDSSTEDGQTITVQLTKSGESRGNSQGTVV
ncbi:uncharacterized protein [Dysidea avara]|uniref:uncharacterized protein n=1 Tax=Dysidea avara TaxID=196820 RepID=UPI00332A79B5